MLTKLNINISNDVNMHATFCLTFANFSRVSEFIYIKVDIQTNDFENWFVIRNHVSLSKDNFTLDISISKIDIFKFSFLIFITIINDVVCFLKSFRHLFIEYLIKSDIFLFQIFDEFYYVQDFTKVLTFIDWFNEINDWFKLKSLKSSRSSNWANRSRR